jgi:hypothetical protein
MGTKSIREIVETAVRAHLVAQTELTGVNVYKGIEVATDALPLVVVDCGSVANPPDLPEGLGNYLCTVTLQVYSSADEASALSVHRDRSAAVLGAMQDLTSLKASFVSGGDATLYDCSPDTVEDGRGDRALGTQATFTLLVVLPA